MAKAKRELAEFDTYEVLEFQGVVLETPKFDPATKELSFLARAYNRPILLLKANGVLGKAFRSVLQPGLLIQAQAVPEIQQIELEGEVAYVIEWRCESMRALGQRTIPEGAYRDVRILDGLRPNDRAYLKLFRK